MTGVEWVAFILAGGLGVPTAVFLLARHLVHQHGNPADAQAYLEWFRAQKAAEGAWQDVEITRQTTAREKELIPR